MADDAVRKGGTRVFAADQGESLTSHGDGTPAIDEGLVEAREQAIKDEENKQQKLRDDADKLLKRSSSNSSGSGSSSSKKDK